MKRQALVYQNIMQRLKDALPMAGPSPGRLPLMPFKFHNHIPPNQHSPKHKGDGCDEMSFFGREVDPAKRSDHVAGTQFPPGMS